MRSLGKIPMQVVEPSVSRAAGLHGTGLWVAVEGLSATPPVARPVVVPGA
jgi:hypothetical protein